MVTRRNPVTEHSEKQTPEGLPNYTNNTSYCRRQNICHTQ